MLYGNKFSLKKNYFFHALILSFQTFQVNRRWFGDGGNDAFFFSTVVVIAPAAADASVSMFLILLTLLSFVALISISGLWIKITIATSIWAILIL